VIRIAITVAAFEAIARTLALGSLGFENKTNERGERLIWLDQAVFEPAESSARTRRERQRRDHPLGERHPLLTRRSFTIPGGASGGRGCSRSAGRRHKAGLPFFDRASERQRQYFRVGKRARLRVRQ
jgi:hypothetical protein